MSLKRCQSSFLHQGLTPACSTLFFTKAGMLWPSNFQRSRLLSTSWHIAVLLPELMASYSIVGLEWRLIKTAIFWDVVKTRKQLRLCKSCDWECWRSSITQPSNQIFLDICNIQIYMDSHAVSNFPSCTFRSRFGMVRAIEPDVVWQLRWRQLPGGAPETQKRYWVAKRKGEKTFQVQVGLWNIAIYYCMLLLLLFY